MAGATGASAAGVTDIGVGTIAWFAGVRNNEGREIKGGNTLIKPAAPKSLRKPKSVIRTIEPTRAKNVEPTLIWKTKDGNLLFKSWKDFVSSLRRATF